MNDKEKQNQEQSPDEQDAAYPFNVFGNPKDELSQMIKKDINELIIKIIAKYPSMSIVDLRALTQVINSEVTLSILEFIFKLQLYMKKEID